MRVLWLSHLLPYPPKGGVLQRSYYLAREAARRFDVDFVALSQGGHQSTDEEIQDGIQALRKFCADVSVFPLRDDQFRWRRLLLLARSYFSSRPYDVNWLAQADYHEHLKRRPDEYDLLHLDTLGLIPYADLFEGTPFVLNHHNVESQLIRDRASNESNPLRRHYLHRESVKLARWERRWCPRAAVNTVVSELDASRLRDRVPADVRTEVVENGVDVEYFQPSTTVEETDGSLVFVGRLSWFPNRDAVRWFIRDIWPLLVEDDPGRTVSLIGKDPPAELQEAADGRRVRVPGFVPDMRPVVDRALAYVCPIRQGGGTRLKVLDALAMAKPLVATDASVEGLNLEEERHYLRAESPEDFVRQIGRLEDTVSLRRRLATEGRQFVERHYAWSVVGDHLASAYSGALEGSAIRGEDVERPG